MLLKRYACATMLSLALSGAVGSAKAADLPSYFKEIVGTQTSSAAEIGTLIGRERSVHPGAGDVSELPDG